MGNWPADRTLSPSILCNRAPDGLSKAVMRNSAFHAVSIAATLRLIEPPGFPMQGEDK
jgi:hypothetical protein